MVIGLSISIRFIFYMLNDMRFVPIIIEELGLNNYEKMWYLEIDICHGLVGAVDFICEETIHSRVDVSGGHCKYTGSFGSIFYNYLAFVKTKQWHMGT